MRKKIFITLILGLAICAFTTFALSAADKERKKKNDDLYRQVELFSDALAIIQNDYVSESEPKLLIYGALKGMLSSLDPHSQFMDPEDYAELKADTEGRFGGIGIEITVEGGLLTVVTPIDDTPAWRAGLKSGDRIVKIDSELTREMTLTDAVKRLRGKPGAAVDIIVLRESEGRVMEFKIVRDMIKVRDIKEARILEDGIAYIRVVEFSENTYRDIVVALDNLKKSGMNALVLDLRNNPGGLLDVAVKVAEKFIDKGKMVVYTKSRRAGQDLQFISDENNPITDIPMVVLINAGSASGSEIVAGCLQDHKRALIVGEKSFGKGSVQTVLPLSDGSALRLTTSKYFTPLGKEIHGKGVIPDITAEEGKIETKDKKANISKEAEEAFQAIENKDKKEEKGKPQEEKKVFDYKSDSQLMRAIDMLKAVKIYSGTNG